ncbi:MAG: glycosyltransferase [Bacteroidota bacterium]|nr:glycosyltransferase [Bacteroidota bacterium]
MKILFVSDTYYPHVNGVYYFVCRIAPMLQAEGHEVAVIAPSESMSASFKKIDDIDVYGIPSFSVLFYSTIRIPLPFLKKHRIRKIIKNFNPDIIHIQDHFLICKAVLRLNRELKIPIIATNHFMPENLTMLVRSPKLKQFFEKFLWKDFSKAFNQVKLVTTPTETGVDIIRSRLSVETVAISSGIDLKKFTPFGDTRKIKEKYNIPDNPILLYAGRIDPEKHIEEILQAVAIASKKIDFCFVIVGKGISKKSLEYLVDKLGINENVIFTGFVPDEDLPYFFKLSRCFIIASIAELLSLVTLQAMASGLPIIAVKAGALVELVKDKLNGYLYDEGDLPALAQYIENILTNDDLYQEMSKKSLEYVQEHDINKTLKSFEKVYQDYTNNNLEINTQL